MNVVDKSLPSMRHDTATTPVLPSVHTETNMSRRCACHIAASFSLCGINSPHLAVHGDADYLQWRPQYTSPPLRTKCLIVFTRWRQHVPPCKLVPVAHASLLLYYDRFNVLAGLTVMTNYTHTYKSYQLATYTKELIQTLSLILYDQGIPEHTLLTLLTL